MPRVIHFEIPTDDLARAKKFYEDVFGWQIHSGTSPYWLAMTGEQDQPGINGALLPRATVHQRPVNVIQVDSVDEFITKVMTNGGRIIRAKQSVPGVGYAAYGKDSEGNPFGLFQADKTAR